MLKDMVTGDSNWTAEVMVIEKGFPRLTEKNRLYQKLVFIDSEKNATQGTIFQEDMSVLKDTLKIYHTYTISNAVVNDTPPKHRVIDNDHQWLLYGRTPIEEVEVKSLSVRALQYNFIPLAHLGEHTNSREGIDAIFAVLKVGTPKRTRETWVQNILIIDQGMQQTVLTLWDQFVEHEGRAFTELSGTYPIALGVRLKVDAQNGRYHKTIQYKFQ
ncbi:hypothetical protein RHMOL_Rhmol02G0318100 [Rhododendron molle]|uniref:Uncharacterized protein n=1 Tax=Rhododendron molle TaxID=49168 RepID=A0ACC0PZ49_RHOML|nr:hypothetical protein RHMOL_Rhmol02G0318100 [Rhododendron molle]